MAKRYKTWREHILEQMVKHGESWDCVEQVAVARSDAWREEDDARAASIDVPFDDGFGAENGDHFTVWTKDRVYFPACYDGAEWCASVPRHPDGTATKHVGG